MRTYKHKYEELLAEQKKQRRYEVAYINAIQENDKLKQIVKAVYSGNEAAVLFYIQDYSSIYKREWQQLIGGEEK